MDKKYQIFVSSTYVDLIEERQQVMRAILEMGHIPVGMEQFSAADEEQWKIIQRQIDQSDYYVVLIAHRYGSTIPCSGGISYTEKEYNYAIEKGIPALGFVIETEATWAHKWYETDTIKISALDAFKIKVKLKPCGFWHDAKDLHGKVAIALMKVFTTQPRVGWVRGDSGVGPEVAEEIARLSKENQELRIAIDKNRNEEADDEVVQESIFMNLKIEIRYNENSRKKIDVKCGIKYMFYRIADSILFPEYSKIQRRNSDLKCCAYFFFDKETKDYCTKGEKYLDTDKFFLNKDEEDKILLFLENRNLIEILQNGNLSVTKKGIKTFSKIKLGQLED